MLYDQHWMASLRNVVGDARERLVYGIDAMRGVARIDKEPAAVRRFAADDAPIFDPYAQTAAYVQSQWFGPRGQQIYVGSARRTRRRHRAAHTRRRSAASLPLATGVQLKLNAATAFRAPTAEELYYPGLLQSESRSRTHARRRPDARRAGALGRRLRWAGYDQRLEPHRVAAAGTTFRRTSVTLRSPG